MRWKGTFGQEKPAARAQHPWGCRISFCYSNPKSACGCPDRASHHLPYPHHCLFPKARHHEHPISLRAPRPPCASDPQDLQVQEAGEAALPLLPKGKGGSHNPFIF